jgi:hypothetical protein
MVEEFPLSGDDCRAHAKRHRDAADRATDPKLRKQHLVLAAEYEKMAIAMDEVSGREA